MPPRLRRRGGIGRGSGFSFPGGGGPSFPPGGGFPRFPQPGGGGGGPSSRFDPQGFVQGAAGAAQRAGTCEQIDNPILRLACEAAVGIAGGSPSEPGSSDSGIPGIQAPGDPCPEGQIRFRGVCISPGDAFPGGDPFITGAGMQATLGQFGTAITPTQEQRTHLTCPDGMVLGKDNLCYNRSVLRKSERKWEPGRKPLLTGGDLNAISKASSAARKLERQKKRLEKIGLMKKPTRRSSPKRASGGGRKARDITVIDTE